MDNKANIVSPKIIRLVDFKTREVKIVTLSIESQKHLAELRE
ncbi:hypothetical protein ACSHUI_00675 [Bacillus subtilis]|nr:hypothetical protein [Bacillus subtilis]GLI90566.1 hypothetical protein ANABIO4_39180 [Bacillus subtilis]